jgi:CO/xanthine dehydrogenase FAD-binding subunit
MRGQVPEFDLIRRANLAETVQLLAEQPGFYKPLAGGTDVMVLLEAGVLKHDKYIDISRLSELHGITVSPDFIEIGACETYTDIQAQPVIRAEFPALVQAGFETGGKAIQNRGTLGGNIANASPAADSPPALMAYGASLKLVSRSGARWVAYDRFHKGYKVMDLRPDELIATVRLPRRKEQSGIVHFYQKAGTRKAQAISKVVFAGVAAVKNGTVQDIACAIGSVAPVTLRCRKVESVVQGKKISAAVIQSATQALLQEISPVDDIRSTRDFRSAVSVNLLQKFLGRLV